MVQRYEFFFDIPYNFSFLRLFCMDNGGAGGEVLFGKTTGYREIILKEDMEDCIELFEQWRPQNK